MPEGMRRAPQIGDRGPSAIQATSPSSSRRNGLPERKDYVYRGLGYDLLESFAEAERRERAERAVAVRKQRKAARLAALAEPVERDPGGA